jgi:hypothetical protein
MADDHWKWGKTMLACVTALRANQTAPCVFIDQELIPHLDGRPDDMFVWFICRTSADKEAFRCSQLAPISDALKERMAGAGFPDYAIASLRTDVTSKEDIEAGGGRFGFFR